MAGRASKIKGVNGEREVLNLLSEELGIPLTRNLDQTREGGEDCTGLHPFSLEIKRHKTLNLGSWWKQSVQQAGADKIPVLAYRLDRQEWKFRVPYHVVAHGAKRPYEINWTVEMGLEPFCEITREWVKL